MKGRVLIVAGSDSGGGAGIQADIKTVTALGGYAMTAITALTAQDTQGVHGIHPVPPDFVARQMRLAFDDPGVDAVKVGMLGDAGVIDAVADVLADRAAGIPVVVDPVMVAKGGAALLESNAASALVRRIVPLATVLTPNLPEAEVLAGMTIRNPADMRRAADTLLAQGAKAVLVKGGHLPGARVVDLLVGAVGAESRERRFESDRIETRHTHGTGCTLSSAIAVGLAQGLALADAVARARAYVIEAIRTAPGYGKGHGPLNHAHTVAGF